MVCRPMRETVLFVDLDRLAENVRRIRQWIGSEPRFTAVVKGDGYGHGAVGIAPTLLENGADSLGVAAVNEAMELRKSGITCPIFLLGNIMPELMPIAANNDITMTAVSLEQARKINDCGRQLGCRLPVQVKLDTGLHRSGIQATEQGKEELLEVLRMPYLEPVGLFSHLAQATDSTDRLQYAAFERMVKTIREAGFSIPPRHICASAATDAYPEYHMEMVDVGTALYGTLSYPNLQLEPIASFRSIVSSIRIIEAGEPIGYGYIWTAQRRTVLGTLPFGHADGYSRQLAGIGTVQIHGQTVPVIGQIAMDQCMVDITDLPEASVGDEVVIFGDGKNGENTVAGLSEMMGVTCGEVVGRISRRVPRVYIRGGVPVFCRDLITI